MMYNRKAHHHQNIRFIQCKCDTPFFLNVFLSVPEKCLRDGCILWRRAKTNFQRHWIDFLMKKDREKKTKHFITPAISTCVQLSAHGPRRASIWTAGIQLVERHVESSVAAICLLISKLWWCTRCSRSRGTGRYTWRRSNESKRKKKKNHWDKSLRWIEDGLVGVTTCVWSSCARRLREGRLHGL